MLRAKRYVLVRLMREHVSMMCLAGGIRDLFAFCGEVVASPYIGKFVEREPRQGWAIVFVQRYMLAAAVSAEFVKALAIGGNALCRGTCGLRSILHR